MNIKQLDAQNAYTQALQGFQQAATGSSGGVGAGSVGASDAASGGGSAFASLVEASIGSVADATQNAETVTAKALTGQADMVDVITAVSNAEMTVNTVVTVRDRMLSAYNDIIKMPV